MSTRQSRDSRCELVSEMREMFDYLIFSDSSQVSCGITDSGVTCAASVCLEKMAAHYEEAHDAEIRGGSFNAKVLDDGSKVARMQLNYDFPNNGEGWFAESGLKPVVFGTAVGGRYALDLQRFSARELRFGVRQLGRGPPRHRLASVKVSFGSADGMCVQYSLSRALAANERLGDAALCGGTPPVVGRVDPAFLAPALVLNRTVPIAGRPWELAISFSLVFQVVRDAPL